MKGKTSVNHSLHIYKTNWNIIKICNFTLVYHLGTLCSFNELACVVPGIKINYNVWVVLHFCSNRPRDSGKQFNKWVNPYFQSPPHRCRNTLVAAHLVTLPSHNIVTQLVYLLQIPHYSYIEMIMLGLQICLSVDWHSEIISL